MHTFFFYQSFTIFVINYKFNLRRNRWFFFFGQKRVLEVVVAELMKNKKWLRKS